MSNTPRGSLRSQPSDLDDYKYATTHREPDHLMTCKLPPMTFDAKSCIGGGHVRRDGESIPQSFVEHELKLRSEQQGNEPHVRFCDRHKQRLCEQAEIDWSLPTYRATGKCDWCKIIESWGNSVDEWRQVGVREDVAQRIKEADERVRGGFASAWEASKEGRTGMMRRRELLKEITDLRNKEEEDIVQTI